MPRKLYKKTYDVEKIVGKRYNIKLKEIEYQVKWKGYESKFNTWEPLDHLQNQQVKKMVDEYDKQLQNVQYPLIEHLDQKKLKEILMVKLNDFLEDFKKDHEDNQNQLTEFSITIDNE